MSRYWARVATDGTVLDIIKADEDFISSGLVGDPDQFIETTKDNEDGFRGQMARIGGKYNKQLDQFQSIQPYASWVWNDTEWHWEAPVALEEGLDPALYAWSEKQQAWVTEDNQ